MTKSEFKECIQQDLLRYEIRQPFSFRVFIKCFGIYYAPGLKFTLIYTVSFKIRRFLYKII